MIWDVSILFKINSQGKQFNLIIILSAKTVLLWRKAGIVISNGGQALDKSKYHVVDVTKLKIIQATENDEAAYSCEVFPANISLNFNLVAGNKNEVVYSGVSALTVTGALLIAAVAAVFLRI